MQIKESVTFDLCEGAASVGDIKVDIVGVPNSHASNEEVLELVQAIDEQVMVTVEEYVEEVSGE